MHVCDNITFNMYTDRFIDKGLSFCMLQRCFTHFSTILKIHQVVKEIHYTSNINTCTRRYVHDGFVVLIVVTEGDFRKIRFIGFKIFYLLMIQCTFIKWPPSFFVFVYIFFQVQ